MVQYLWFSDWDEGWRFTISSYKDGGKTIVDSRINWHKLTHTHFPTQGRTYDAGSCGVPGLEAYAPGTMNPTRPKQTQRIPSWCRRLPGRQWILRYLKKPDGLLAWGPNRSHSWNTCRRRCSRWQAICKRHQDLCVLLARAPRCFAGDSWATWV